MKKVSSLRSVGVGGSGVLCALSVLPFVLVAVVTVLQIRQEALYPEAHLIHHGRADASLRASGTPWHIESHASPKHGDPRFAGFLSGEEDPALQQTVGRVPSFGKRPASLAGLKPPDKHRQQQEQAAVLAQEAQQALQTQPGLATVLGNVSSAGAEGTGAETTPGAAKMAEWQLPRFIGDGAPTNAPSILLATTTGDKFERIFDWYRYHRAIGVDVFYLFVEGRAAEPDCVEKLRQLPGVIPFLRTEELERAHAASRVWNETWLAAFFDKPCNYELFVRQNLNLETAIRKAFREGLDWILHIDTDELLYPGGTPAYGLKQLLGGVPREVETLVFPNYETAVERDNVRDPFTEVTMFKRNFDHVIKDVYFKHYKETSRGNPNYFLTYGNGKAAARIVPGLRPNGAHRFHNYNHAPIEVKAEEAAVLHYTYARFDDVVTRRGRCNCGNSDEEIEKCFILAFDRLVFKTAAQVKDDELRKWYRDRVVWGNRDFNRKMLASGLFARIHTPALLVMGLRAAGTVDAFADGFRVAVPLNRTRPDSEWVAKPMPARKRLPGGNAGAATTFKSPPPAALSGQSSVHNGRPVDPRQAIEQLRGKSVKGSLASAVVGLANHHPQPMAFAGSKAVGGGVGAGGGGASSVAVPPAKVALTGGGAAKGGKAGAGTGAGAGLGAGVIDGIDPNAGQAEDALAPAQPPMPAPAPPKRVARPSGKASAAKASAARTRAAGHSGGGNHSAGAVASNAQDGVATGGNGAHKAAADSLPTLAVRGGRKRGGGGATGVDGGGAGVKAGSGDGASVASGAAGATGKHGDFLKTSRGGAKRVDPASGGSQGAGADASVAQGAAAGAGGGAAAAGDAAAVAADPPAPPPVESNDPEMKEWAKVQAEELEKWVNDHGGETMFFDEAESDSPDDGGAAAAVAMAAVVAEADAHADGSVDAVGTAASAVDADAAAAVLAAAAAGEAAGDNPPAPTAVLLDRGQLVNLRDKEAGEGSTEGHNQAAGAGVDAVAALGKAAEHESDGGSGGKDAAMAPVTAAGP